MSKERYILIDFAVIDGPAMFEVLRPFQDRGYIRALDYSFEGSMSLEDRADIAILDLSFEQAVEIGEALDKAELDLRWTYYEEEPTQE